MTEEKLQSLLETVADISYIAGSDKYYSGDSREDIADFIKWAKEFEELYKDEDWTKKDYIETVQSFAMEKMSNV